MIAVIKCLLCCLVLSAVVYLALQLNRPMIDALISTEITTLVNKANEFEGRRVTVTGDVVLQGAAILGYGAFRLRQGDSEVWVLTSHGIPASGGQTSVTGIFRQAAKVGNKKIAVLVQD